jgi:hypothetical protein
MHCANAKTSAYRRRASSIENRVTVRAFANAAAAHWPLAHRPAPPAPACSASAKYSTKLGQLRDPLGSVPEEKRPKALRAA